LQWNLNVRARGGGLRLVLILYIYAASMVCWVIERLDIKQQHAPLHFMNTEFFYDGYPLNPIRELIL